MAENIYIPKLGMTMEEAKLAEWKAREGDRVEAEQVVLVIDTEKVSHEIEAGTAGYLIILHDVGTVLKCGEVAGIIAETKDEFEELRKERPSPKPVEVGAAAAAPVVEKAPAREGGRVKISPLARKIAEEHNLDIATIAGTGPGGRIVKEDVLKAIESPKEAAIPSIPPSGDVIDGKRVKETIPLTGMRKVIADHMIRSLQVSAQLTTMGEIDMTEMIKLRSSLLERENSIGVRISYTDIFIFIAARVLREVPLVNSSLIENEIRMWDDINVSFAVSIGDGIRESGLMVPVIRNADRKSLVAISRERQRLMEKVRTGTISLDDMVGGTFTITNMGVFSSEWSVSTPIINQPQSAILGTGAIVDRPAVRDGELCVRPMMAVMLTFDHRVLDGAPVGMFLMKMHDYMLHPELLLL